ncbi:MAG: thioredoxin family protein [Rhodoferax sp.]|uniref:thioredoxin family protein n=1 Tax=Rhodoferax sp. TaxID=50421 RepID=UPI003016C89B
MNFEAPTLDASVLVVCLCAEWCGVCREYEDRFAQMQSRFPHARFLWLDVEDEADLMHPLDVENFPTLLVAVGNEPRFFGPVTPQPELLERLIRAQTQDACTPTLADPAVAQLVRRIREAKHL